MQSVVTISLEEGIYIEYSIYFSFLITKERIVLLNHIEL